MVPDPTLSVPAHPWFPPLAMLILRTPSPDELPLLKDFAPPDWSTDLAVTFSFHFGQPYFHPLVAVLDGKIVGCADGLLNGNAGWLGNIIVLPEFRGQGIGYALTAELAKIFHLRGVVHQILIATKMGEPVYRKLGFETVSNYIFLKRETDRDLGQPADALRQAHTVPASFREDNVRPATELDFPAILSIDEAITGERRALFLSHFLTDAWVHTAPWGTVNGFYLPGLANGPVLAENDAAGLELLRLRLGRGAQTTVIPEANAVALDYLLANGFVETAQAPRMVLGPDADWKPGRIYSRGSGYCG